MSHRSLPVISAFVLALSIPVAASAGPVLFESSGANAASIQASVDAFRAALGDPVNGNNPGPLAAGRREINWDGGGATTTATSPNNVFTVFQTTRGGTFTTPGTNFVQAVLTDLANNATYAATFTTFSPQRIFAPLGSNVTDATFSIPGSPTIAAGVSAFGVVFSDVDDNSATTIDFFGVGGVPLFSRAAMPGTLSFLGVQFDAGELITKATIRTGNTALGPNDGGGVDVVVMDDFLYAEPKAVPEPSTLSLLAVGAFVAGLARRHRR